MGAAPEVDNIEPAQPEKGGKKAIIAACNLTKLDISAIFSLI